ncbi:hypothetical protein LOY42_13590 [Pseudomonas sp. B21-023]|uniref:SEL1-like repeat protein n=1 Tax=unclassified Pseudomonas TaxID=196821 RepID=UPI0015533E00|nr:MULTISPECIES: sel1 repeat family protein [unclassified Pseudomonas]NQD75331.1 sel1 repeat family protein [Pseudomonas sp. CM27]UVM14341.1 hypothetical protein LOY42_13590 [Pseudomonas sp. B21-023]
MKPDLPPVSPIAFHPMNTEPPLQGRLKLPDGRMVSQACPNPANLDDYCQSKFGRSWRSIERDCLRSLANRIEALRGRFLPLEALINQGQFVESLDALSGDIWESLGAAYSDGSSAALILISKLSLITGTGSMEGAMMAADLGNVAAYCFLGDHYLSKEQVEQAAAAYQQGMAKGCSACEYQLGQFAERGVGGQLKSVRVAFDHYAEATMGNYPPAWVAIARLWLSDPGELPRHERLVEMLKECVEMRCEGAATALAEIYLAYDQSSYTKRMVMSLYRGAAVEGDIETQLKLASLLAGEGASEMEIEPDPEEALRWYERVYSSENASPAQAILAHLKLGYLFMGKNQYDRAAHHFAFASDTDLEAAELQRICEEKGENLRRWRLHNIGGECL